MRIAVHASHTIDEKGCPGCVAIKNEAIEARVIVEKMLQVAATYDNVELIDCSVNYADSYVGKCDIECIGESLIPLAESCTFHVIHCRFPLAVCICILMQRRLARISGIMGLMRM